MKQIFLLLFFAVGLSVNAQLTTANLSLQPGYSDVVYYQFSSNTSQSFSATDWDIAFLRTGQFSFAARINDAAGIEVYEASNNPGDWGIVDPANIGNWTQLHNSDTTWVKGAFDQGTASYGWGEYNATSHHVEGTIVFVLKYADGTFRKFMIEDFYNGYTFKYADWNATTSAWEADETYVLPNSTNPNNQFNYFSLITDSEVSAAPAMSDWDLVFQRYSTDVGGGMMYAVTGVLHHPGISVAENVEPGGSGDTSNLQYFSEINTIGYDWKSFDGSAYIIETDKYFYLKLEDDSYYRMHFTSYEGGSTGNLAFEYENVTGQMSVTNFDAENSFAIYPNPSTDKRIQLLYENNLTNGKGNVRIFSLTGKKVFEMELKNDGFSNQTLNLSELSSGVYLLKFQAGDFSATEKIVLK